jgi:hypothetical protein
MSRDVVFGLLLVVGGLLLLTGGIYDWDLVMNSRRARPVVYVFGRIGARIFYGILGVIFFMAGGMMVLTILNRG